MQQLRHIIIALLLLPLHSHAQITGRYQNVQEGIITQISFQGSTFDYSETFAGAHEAFISHGRVEIQEDTLLLHHKPYIHPKPRIEILNTDKRSEVLQFEIYALDSAPLANSNIYFKLEQEIKTKIQTNALGKAEIKITGHAWDEIIIEQLHAAEPLILAKNALDQRPGKIIVYLPMENLNSYNKAMRTEKYILRNNKLLPLTNTNRTFERMTP